jgi:hypothetical protein
MGAFVVASRVGAPKFRRMQQRQEQRGGALTRRRWLEVARITALVLVIATTWCLVERRTTGSRFQVPLAAESDALGMLAGAKAAAEGDFQLFLPKIVTRLGAPQGANWNDWPIVDEPLFVVSGWVARVIGLFAAVNLMVLIAHVLAGVAFYLVCRWLRYRWQWAFTGSLVFALSHFAFHRGLPHLTLTFFWHIPLCLLVVWWCGSRAGLRFRSGRFAVAVGVAVATAVQNPYYTGLFLQLLGITALAHLLRGDFGRRFVVPTALAAVTLGCFVLMNIDTMRHQWAHGPNPEPSYRSYRNSEMFALKPLDLFVPPATHRFEPARQFASAYLTDETRKTILPGEAFSSYLGIAGAVAFVWLALVAVRRVAAFPNRPLPVHAVQIVWIILFSVAGGVNGMLGQLGLTAFRCPNRYSIFILALVLLFAVRELTRLSRRWHPAAVWLLPLLMLPVFFWDQLPQRPSRDSIRAAATALHSDRAFASAMEAELPRGAMVFQLPVMRFPESWPIHQMGDYEHLRPYLHSSHLRFSYGTNKGRGDADWQIEASRKPPAKMLRIIERAGFAAIYINRKGFPDGGAELLARLEELGYTRRIESPLGDLVCVFIRPAAEPVLPERPPSFSRGWYDEEGDPAADLWRHSSGNAEVQLFNSTSGEREVDISFELSSFSPRTVRLLLDGETLYTSPPLTPQRVRHTLSLRLPPGATTLRFATEPPVTFPGNPDTRVLGFILYNFRVSDKAAGDDAEHP